MWMKSEKSGCLGSWNSQKHRDGHQNRKPWMTISLRIPIRILDAQQLLVGRAFLWLSLSSFLGGSLTGQGRKRLIWNLESENQWTLRLRTGLSRIPIPSKGWIPLFLERLDCQKIFRVEFGPFHNWNQNGDDRWSIWNPRTQYSLRLRPVLRTIHINLWGLLSCLMAPVQSQSKKRSSLTIINKVKKRKWEWKMCIFVLDWRRSQIQENARARLIRRANHFVARKNEKDVKKRLLSVRRLWNNEKKNKEIHELRMKPMNFCNQRPC